MPESRRQQGVPPDRPDRRSKSGGPPTQLIEALKHMSPEERRSNRRLGTGIIAFTLVLPMLGQLALLVLGREAITPWLWLFSAGGLLVGLAFVNPPLAVWAASTIPGFIRGLVPTRFRIEDRREDRREDAHRSTQPGAEG